MDFKIRCAVAGIGARDWEYIGFEDAMVAILGYEQRVNDGWQQTRIIAYTIACTVTEKEERGEIYDMFPLPGDPTAEERENARRMMYEDMVAESKLVTEMVREQLNMTKNK